LLQLVLDRQCVQSAAKLTLSTSAELRCAWIRHLISLVLCKHSPCHFIHHNDTIACCVKQTTETRQQASENDSDQTTSSITKGWSLAHAKNLSQRITSAVSFLDIPGSLQSSDRLSQYSNAATCSRSGKLLGLDIECRQRLIRFQHPERSPDVRLHACHVQSSSSACRTDRREHGKTLPTRPQDRQIHH
jgi:hypothetical protein